MANILIRKDMLSGGLELILDFRSITFFLVRLFMAVANFKIRSIKGSSTWITALSIIGLDMG
jgi:hypothetical protein